MVYMNWQDDLDNHANQLNQDHEEYWHSREAGQGDDNDQYYVTQGQKSSGQLQGAVVIAGLMTIAWLFNNGNE